MTNLAFSHYKNTVRSNPRLTQLIGDVAGAFSVDPVELFEPSRSMKSVADARHVVAWAVRHWVPKPSFPEIGKMLNRDHTTIMHAVRRIDEAIQSGDILGQLALRIAGLPVVQLIPGEGASFVLPTTPLELDLAH